MIQDYERKLREYEKEKDLHRYREKTLIKRIMDLEKV